LAILIGAEATDRASTLSDNYTLVGKDVPANDTGTVATVEIWANVNLSDCEVATFSASGDNLTTRDSELLGAVTAGSKQTFSGLSMDAVTGDYLGVYFSATSSGRLESDTTGGAGIWYLSGDYIPCTAEAFNPVLATTIMSLHGIGMAAYSESASVSIGELVTVTRTAVFTRTSSAIIGELVTAARTAAFTRTATVLAGIVATASRVKGYTVSASVIIGELVTVVRTAAFTRASSVISGIVATASRAGDYTRSASVIIGELVSATRTAAFTRTSSIILGVTVSVTWLASRILKIYTSVFSNDLTITSTFSNDLTMTSTMSTDLTITSTMEEH
jgi:hypothetical protein